MIFARKLIAGIIATVQLLLINIGVMKPEMLSSKFSPIAHPESKFVMPDSSETDLYKSVEYAHRIKNQVQCSYSDSQRDDYIMTNMDMILTHNLTDVVKTATLTDKYGNPYIEDSFKSFYTDRLGVKHYFEESVHDGRINTIRLGEYYYECHLRDMSHGIFKVDKDFHVYSDKLYFQYSLLANLPMKTPAKFGSEINIDAKTVNSLVIRDKNGEHTSLLKVDAKSVEYVAFDIKNVGVVGFIVPSDGSTLSLSVCKIKGDYVITQLADLSPYKGINKFDETGDYDTYKIDFGFRVYNDKTHSFDGIKLEADKERNPLNLTVTATNADAKCVGYDALRGAYTVEMKGMGFNEAYREPDKRFNVSVKVDGDDIDRNIFVRTTSTETGCLESAVVYDKNNLLMPIDVEVCKNFQGDGGDNEYSYYDYLYSDTFTPVTVEKNTSKELKVDNLYQNWGNYPLKQISAIEFHTAYYHFSTGTTESNCIAPYFVYGKDGWTLPDFRTRSGIMWSSQPQFDGIGRLKFVSYRDNSVKNKVYSEFLGSKINSYGPTYADIVNYYASDSGKFTYTLNHMEFPQVDENRTYYNLKIDFTDTITFENFKRDFDLYYFDGRFVSFDKFDYLNESNEPVTVPTNSEESYYTLGDEAPFFGFYNIHKEPDKEPAGCNMALLIKDSKILMNGKKADIPFAVFEKTADGLSEGHLTLDAEKLTFNKGDSIEINLILLPWGRVSEENDSNVLKVREDSCLKPLTVAGADNNGFIPTVKAVNNKAEFTIKGGRNNNAVKVDGFTSINQPTIYQLVNGNWVKYNLESVNKNDGYMIRTNDNNTFSISFVYNAENPDKEYTFKIEN